MRASIQQRRQEEKLVIRGDEYYGEQKEYYGSTRGSGGGGRADWDPECLAGGNTSSVVRTLSGGASNTHRNSA